MVPRSRRVPKNAGRSPAAVGRTVDPSVLPSVGDTAVVLVGSSWLLIHVHIALTKDSYSVTLVTD
jgi:hypothetical protein